MAPNAVHVLAHGDRAANQEPFFDNGQTWEEFLTSKHRGAILTIAARNLASTIPFFSSPDIAVSVLEDLFLLQEEVKCSRFPLHLGSPSKWTAKNHSPSTISKGHRGLPRCVTPTVLKAF